MISAQEALRAGKDNEHDRWVGSQDCARDRIANRVVVPRGRQSFTAAPSDTFFAIGSCFARNVEERLEMAGAEVISRRFAIDDLGDSSARHTGIFNKYTPLSILQELKWAAGEEEYPQEALLHLGGDDWYDPHLRLNSGHGTRQSLLARRAQIAQYFAQAFTADVVIITLGLIETWVDLETQLSLNVIPDPKVLARDKARFAFRRLTVDDCTEALEGIFAILRERGKAGQRIVLTVSPVALGRTFTQDDVIVANMTSKATLRVAAMEFVGRHQGVDYFPSYEAVLHSDPAVAWQADRLHASDFMVGRIIDAFLSRYGLDAERAELPLPDADPQALLIAQLRKEVDKYKNKVIALQGTLHRLGVELPDKRRS